MLRCCFCLPTLLFVALTHKPHQEFLFCYHWLYILSQVALEASEVVSYISYKVIYGYGFLLDG